MVREFRNNKSWSYQEALDMTMHSDADLNLLPLAGQNMKGLSKAVLMPNALAVSIISNLTDYSQLVELSVHGFFPNDHMWPIAPLALRKLVWDLPRDSFSNRETTAVATVAQLIDIVEATCPALESLDISHSSNLMVEDYQELPKHNQQITRPNRTGQEGLTHIRHFGLGFRSGYVHGFDDHQAVEQINSFVGYVKRYAHTLNSITIPIPDGAWSRSA